MLRNHLHPSVRRFLDTDGGTPPAASVPAPTPSGRPIGSPRVLNVYSNRWHGPRPAFVLKSHSPQTCNLRVYTEGDADGIGGDSRLVTSCQVFEPMTAEQREARLENMDDAPGSPAQYWAEWPTADATRASGGVTPDVGDRLNKFGEDLAYAQKALFNPEDGLAATRQELQELTTESEAVTDRVNGHGGDIVALTEKCANLRTELEGLRSIVAELTKGVTATVNAANSKPGESAPTGD